jgi:hypothetical protein
MSGEERPFLLDAIYARDENLVFRRIGEEVILVPIRRQAADLEAIYTINETGASIWEMLDGRRTLAEIRDALTTEYEVTTEAAQADVLEFIQMLEEFQGVRRVR